MPENAVLSYPVWFCYGVGHVFNDLCASMWFTYFLIFFNSVLEIDSRLTGAALAIGQIADGISTQLIGVLADKKSDRWIYQYGRRKIWHLIGTVCVFVSFPFIFSRIYGFQNLDGGSKLLYYSVFIVVFQFGWAATQISHLALIPDLTPFQHERTGLLSLRYSFTVLSNMTVYSVLWGVLYLTCNKEETFGPNDKEKFQIVAFIVVILGSATSLIFHVGVKEENHSHSETDQSELLSDSLPSRGSLFCSRKLYQVACVYIATRLFFNLSQVYIPYFLHAYLKLSSKDLAILPLVMFISSFMTSAVIKPLNVQFGRKTTYILGALIGIGASVWVYVGRVDDFYYKAVEVYGVVIAFGCAGSVLLVTSLGLTADLVGDNTHYGAFVYGFMSLGDKVLNGLAVLLIENLRTLFDCDCYYRNVLSLCCGVAGVLGILSIIFINLAPTSERTVVTVDERRNREASDTE